MTDYLCVLLLRDGVKLRSRRLIRHYVGLEGNTRERKESYITKAYTKKKTTKRPTEF
jgi:hypothetical protein